MKMSPINNGGITGVGWLWRQSGCPVMKRWLVQSRNSEQVTDPPIFLKRWLAVSTVSISQNSWFQVSIKACDTINELVLLTLSSSLSYRGEVLQVQSLVTYRTLCLVKDQLMHPVCACGHTLEQFPSGKNVTWGKIQLYKGEKTFNRLITCRKCNQNHSSILHFAKRRKCYPLR